MNKEKPIKVKKLNVLYSDKEIGHIIFKLSKEDKTNNIKGGLLLISFGGFYTYYIDTLMENYLEYINGTSNLCIDGGLNLSILNMGEIINFILVNRGEIEQELRGIYGTTKEELMY